MLKYESHIKLITYQHDHVNGVTIEESGIFVEMLKKPNVAAEKELTYQLNYNQFQVQHPQFIIQCNHGRHYLAMGFELLE